MAVDDIPFDRSMPTRADDCVTLSPLVHRIIAGNGGPFTFTGTCSYLVGRDALVVIDPGPADRLHRDALLRAIGTTPVAAILVTHSHRDHAPGALDLKAATGAPIMGCAPYRPSKTSDHAQPLDTAHDGTYAPDRILAEGDVVEGDGFALTALATPGHTANHLAFALDAERALFSGDHVMAWSTTVVAPPDGTMRSYMASLEKLLGRTDRVFWPGHGGPVNEPQRFVRGLLQHRRQREQAILGRLRQGDREIAAIVRVLYPKLAPALRGAAALSVLAHLEDLATKGLVAIEGGEGLSARYSAEPTVG